MTQTVVRIIFSACLGIGVIFFMQQMSLADSGDQTTHVRDNVIACQSKNLFQHIVRLLADKNRNAAENMAHSAILAGKCVILKPGMQVHVENVELLGPTQVRPVGDTVAYWTNGEMIN